MVKFAQERDFANDVAGDAALGSLIGEWNAFDGHLLVGCRPITAIDHAVRSLANHLRSGHLFIVAMHISAWFEREEEVRDHV